jgi:two-component sensor histidine kinase
VIRLGLIFALIAAVGIVASALAARRAYDQEVTIERVALARAIDSHVQQVRDRLADRELLTQVVVGLIHTAPAPQPDALAPLRHAIEAFKSDFVLASWIERVEPADIAQIKPLLRQSGFPRPELRQFDDRELPDGYSPSGAIAVLMDVEPRTPETLQLPGRIVDAAPIIWPTLVRAAETRTTTCSDPLILPRTDATLGLILAAPVYDTNISERPRGFVTFSYRLASLMLARDDGSPFNVAVRDPRSTRGEFIAEDATAIPPPEGSPVVTVKAVSFGGRQWTLEYAARRDPTVRAFSLAMVVATIGFSLTSIICGLFGYVAFNNLRLSREIGARVSFEDRLGDVIGELNHRVKNILAVIQSIVTRTLRDGSDVNVARDMLIGRIHAMSHVVSLLSDSDWQGVRFRSLLESSISPALRQVEADGPDMTIGARAAQSLSLLLFELGSYASNGSGDDRPARIELRWSTSGEGADAKFNLRWEEFEPRLERNTAEGGFGDVLLDRVVPEALGGTSKRYLTEASRVYELTASLAVVVDQPEINRANKLAARPRMF